MNPSKDQMMRVIQKVCTSLAHDFPEAYRIGGSLNIDILTEQLMRTSGVTGNLEDQDDRPIAEYIQHLPDTEKEPLIRDSLRPLLSGNAARS